MKMVSVARIAAVLVFAVAGPAGAVSPVTLLGPPDERYQAVVTQRTLQAKTATTPAIVQPTLTVYRLRAGGRVKVWIAPPSVIPRVERVSNYPMGWSPLTLTVDQLSAASLIPGYGQQLVASIHQGSADCGGSEVHVLRIGGDKVTDVAAFQNPCSLGFKVAGPSLVLDGPGYGPNDAMCCPSKPKASATLRYAGGAWTLRPRTYKKIVPKA